MLGEKRAQTYLLRFENNAEIRAPGGLPGAWALLSVRDGKIRMVRQGSTRDFKPFILPIVPPTVAERTIFQSLPVTYWQSTGFAPDFPRNAQLGAAMWKATFPGTRIDGVLDVDAVAMVRMLAVLGPVRTRVGVTITADNGVKELLSRVYQRFENPPDQDDFFADVAKKVFDKVSAADAPPLTLLSALTRDVNDGRIHVYSFHPSVQRQLAGTTIAGDFSYEATRHPNLTMTVNDLTQAKMSYYLSYSVETRATRCSGGQQTYQSTARFSASKEAGRRLPLYVTGPDKKVPTGTQLVVARVYGPVGSVFGQFFVAGKSVWVRVDHDRGRPVADLTSILEPGQSRAITWTLTTGKGQTADGVQQVTPGLNDPQPFRTRIISAC